MIWGLLTPYPLFCQKHDYNFLAKHPYGLGGASISYSDSLSDIIFEPFYWDGSVIGCPTFSDFDGNPLFYHNHLKVYDSLGRVAINGDSIGVGYFQDLLLSSFPDNTGATGYGASAVIPISDSLFYLFHQSTEAWIGAPGWAIDIEEQGLPLQGYSDGLYLTKIRVRDDGRIYIRAEEKKLVILDEIMALSEFSVCKHASGKGYWIHVNSLLKDTAKRFLISEEGKVTPFGAYIYSDQNGRVNSASSVKFSSDGSKMSRLQFSNRPAIHSKLEIFDFDRCTGKGSRFFLDSFRVVIEATSFVGDTEFSSSGQYLYVGLGGILLQLDLESPSIMESIDTIWQWSDEMYSINPIFVDQFITLPNDKILCSAFPATPFLHTIHEPNLKGSACDFQFSSHMMPLDSANLPFHIFITGFPRFPNYRMEPSDINCTTSIDEEERLPTTSVQLLPNPTSDILSLSNGRAFGEYKIFNTRANMVLDGDVESTMLDVSDLATGVYFLVLEDVDLTLRFVKM